MARDTNKKNRSKKTTEGGRTPFAKDLEFEASEAYNVLRTNLILSLPGMDRGKVIGITSSCPHEGKSYNTVNLAYALAKNGDKTLLISADMRKPTIETYYEVPMSPGLSNLLTGSNGAKEALPLCNQMTEQNENLYVLAAGDIPPNPSELLGSRSMSNLIHELTGVFDYILIDLPPVTTVVDPIAVSPNLDGMLLVARHGFTKRRMLTQAVRQLRFANVRIIGFVYNGFVKHNGGSYRRKKDKGETKSYDTGAGYYKKG